MQPERLSSFSGEFKNPVREAAFLAERLPETVRHARLLFLLSAILNTLFFFSDWRFQGEPHFYVAVPARAVVVAIALVCLVAIGHMKDFAGAQRIMLAWQWINGLAVAALVSSHSDIAFFVVIMLPSIYYLVVPTAFRWTLASGIGCSIMMLVGYMEPEPIPTTAIGLVLAMVMLNCALILVVARTNRLSRMEWGATQAERHARRQLAMSRETLEKTFMAVPIPLVVSAADDGRILKVNDAARVYFGADPNEYGLRSIEEIYLDRSHRGRLVAALKRDGRVSGFETTIRLADGSPRDVLVAATTVEIGGVMSVIAGSVDITDRKALEMRLERLATSDPLTGLANRTHFLAVAEKQIQHAQRYGLPLAVLMVDMDHFKWTNDTFGHEMGDLVLREFAALCRQTLRQSDLVGRLGGEEFAILLPNADRESAVAVAERLRTAMETLKPGDAPASLASTVSIGVAQVHPDEGTLDAALARADRALYTAKRGGRNRVCSDESDPARPDPSAARLDLVRSEQPAALGPQDDDEA